MLTPEAKQLLSKTIRDLRARLLLDLHSAAESRYQLSLPADKAALAEEPRKKRERLEAWLDERVRTAHPKTAKDREAACARLLLDAVKEASAPLLNRLAFDEALRAGGENRVGGKAKAAAARQRSANSACLTVASG
ncbi:MAG TPA: hypothetical protein DFS52_00115 [Myxococcales bacterium]|jgi:restriction endonuclease Mrr|nr:hypothetical protein [Myxococcales bacterium]